MPKQKSRPSVTVRSIDNTTHESYSLTVDTPDVKNVAQIIEYELNRHWTTTRFSDNRHKRRF